MIIKWGHNDSATIEHVQPLSKGGTSEYFNLMAVCYDCNQKRGNMPLSKWLKHLRENVW